MRYRAFLSYSHADEAAVSKLHRRMEQFRVPKTLARSLKLSTNRLGSMFRDRDELSANSSLSDVLQEALENSEFLIVACSPQAASSRWVDQEIRHFLDHSDISHVLAVIVDGQPGDILFPESLRFELDTDGQIDQTRPLELLAADWRDQGDGPEAASLKLIASILDVPFDTLVQREQQAKQQRLRNIAIGASLGMLITVGLATYAWSQRNAAQLEAAKAQRVVEFLIGTFEVAEPATENPQTITAVQILDRGRERLVDELNDEPEILGTLLATVGQVYLRLGLYDRAEDTLLESLVDGRATKTETADRTVRLAQAKLNLSKLAEVEPLLEQALAHLGDGPEAEILQARIAIGRFMLALQEPDNNKARELIEYAYTRILRHFGPDNVETAKVKAMMSNVYRALGQFPKAQEHLNDAIRISTLTKGLVHSRTANLLQARASLYVEMGLLDQAQQDSEQALTTLTKILGDSHPELAKAYFSKGRIEFSQQKPAAADSFDQALAMISTHFGAVSGFRAVVLLFAASAQARNGQEQEALAMIDESSQIIAKVYPPNHSQNGFVITQRGVVHGELGQPELATQYCQLGIEHLEALPGVSPRDMEIAHEDCAQWLPVLDGPKSNP